MQSIEKQKLKKGCLTLPSLPQPQNAQALKRKPQKDLTRPTSTPNEQALKHNPQKTSPSQSLPQIHIH